VGGSNAQLNEFPWRCNLFHEFLGHYCGCAVISENMVITAAHCSAAAGRKFLLVQTYQILNLMDSTYSIFSCSESESKCWRL